MVLYVLCSASWFNCSTALAAEQDLLVVNDTEITIEIHPAQGELVAIWLPSEAGPQPVDEQLAAELAGLGIEVWRVDLVEAHFLPQVVSSVDKLPAEDITALMEYSYRETSKRVLFIATGRSAIPVLRGLHKWQLNRSDSSALLGVVLFSPKFFVETPDPGMAGELMPIVSSSNLPIYIIQPDQSPWFWKLKTTVPVLERGGSDVYVRILRKVRDRYFFRPDATEREKQLTLHTPKILTQAARLLGYLPREARKVNPLNTQLPDVREGKKNRLLSDYAGNPKPPPLQLSDLDGQLVDLTQLKGKVVLINFWATWCPPCVHEMPSMQRLQEKMQGKPFVILAVNMAEDKATVKEFLNTKVRVNFPVLFDTNGKALQDWGVYAFPTSFVIDKNGLIQYALFGSIDWDEDEIVNKITALTIN
ncbi:TlpA disulfide reductase family protein [Kaarinaea lacus]